MRCKALVGLAILLALVGTALITGDTSRRGPVETAGHVVCDDCAVQPVGDIN